MSGESLSDATVLLINRWYLMSYRIKTELIYLYSCLSTTCPQETSPVLLSLTICYYEMIPEY